MIHTHSSHFTDNISGTDSDLIGTQCPIHHIELSHGIAIDPKGSTRGSAAGIVWRVKPLKVEDVELKKCLKCPLCGYSIGDIETFRPYYR